MITNTAESVSIGSANLEKISFTMKASEKAFSIFSDKIYEDKIAACIREYSTNALDAHILAGCPEKPFEVSLPTKLNMNFSVRDFGPGLTHDQIINIFTVFFESTKEDSNDFVGGFGLGSKAAFSYGSKSFMVKSFTGTSCTTYSMYIDGIPKCTVLATIDSTEPSGLEIIIPVVDSNDINEFNNIAEQIYLFFDVKPILKNTNIGFNMDLLYFNNIYKVLYSSTELKYSYVKFIINNNNIPYLNSKAVISMGNVRYVIPSSLDILSPILTYRQSIIINFDIGELSIQPGREKLSLDEITIKTLKTRLQLILDDIINKIVEDKGLVNNTPRQIIYHINSDSNINQRKLANVIFDTLKYNGNSISSYMSKFQKFDYTKYGIADDYYIKSFGQFNKSIKKNKITNTDFISNCYSYSKSVVILIDDGEFNKPSVLKCCNYLLNKIKTPIDNNIYKYSDIIVIKLDNNDDIVYLNSLLLNFEEADFDVYIKSEIASNVNRYFSKASKKLSSSNTTTQYEKTPCLMYNNTTGKAEKIFMTSAEFNKYSGQVLVVSDIDLDLQANVDALINNKNKTIQDIIYKSDNNTDNLLLMPLNKTLKLININGDILIFNYKKYHSRAKTVFNCENKKYINIGKLIKTGYDNLINEIGLLNIIVYNYDKFNKYLYGKNNNAELILSYMHILLKNNKPIDFLIRLFTGIDKNSIINNSVKINYLFNNLMVSHKTLSKILSDEYNVMPELKEFSKIIQNKFTELSIVNGKFTLVSLLSSYGVSDSLLSNPVKYTKMVDDLITYMENLNA